MQARHPSAVTCSAMLLLRDVMATRRCSGWVCKEAAAEPWWCIAWSSMEGRPKAGDDGAWNHRVVKSLRLEMATRITKPNCQPTTTVCFGGRWVCIASHVDTMQFPRDRGEAVLGVMASYPSTFYSEKVNFINLSSQDRYPQCFTAPFTLISVNLTSDEKKEKKKRKEKPSRIFTLPLQRCVVLPSVGEHALPQWVLFDFHAKKVPGFSLGPPQPEFPLTPFSRAVDELGLIRLTQPRHSSGSLFSFKRTPRFPTNFL